MNLINMEHSHPGIRPIFEGGTLSIRRTSKSFSRSAVDLTLEQTVNRDAASRQTGIVAFTQCVNARKRWTITRTVRGAVVGCLLEMTGLTTREETSHKLKPYRIVRDNSDLRNIIKAIEDTLNPFQDNLLDKLFCLTTGCAASSERPIKRRKIKNFASDAVKTKVKSKDQTILEVRCTRDIFGRLLFLAVTQNMDMATVLSYPLTPVPFTLCHIRGAMNKTNKSALMVKLEGKGDSNKEPSLVDMYVIDAMFFLRTLPELPSTFDGIAKMILQKAYAFAKEVHIVCDKYPEGPSIKHFEREERGNSQAAYQIIGPSQRRPTDFHRALLSASFKTALLRFLKEEWRSSMYAPVMEGHGVYFGLEQCCYVYNTNNGLIQQR